MCSHLQGPSQLDSIPDCSWNTTAIGLTHSSSLLGGPHSCVINHGKPRQWRHSDGLACSDTTLPHASSFAACENTYHCWSNGDGYEIGITDSQQSTQLLKLICRRWRRRNWAGVGDIRLPVILSANFCACPTDSWCECRLNSVHWSVGRH